MVRLTVALSLLSILLTHVSTEVLDFDETGLCELCYTCSCSADKRTVDCSNRGLTEIPCGSSTQVTKLNLSKNEISNFPMDLQKFPNLSFLDVSGNRLTELPENALYRLSVLEVLNLSKNYFDSWLSLHPNVLLKSAPKLKILNLSHNKFKTMDNLANQELFNSSSLETLILDDCDIYSVYGRSPISDLTNLKVLRLSNNPLQRIQNLMSLTLESLYVDNCELSSLNNNELMYLPSLMYLEISHNYRLELSASAYNLFSDSLIVLNISYCQISRPNLQGFPNLRKVILSHNMIRYLNSKEFMNNTKLEHLDLSYNNIGSLKTDTFRGLTLLTHLDLSWNEIAHVPEESLLEMSSLMYFKISRNYLTRVGHLKSSSLTHMDMSSCEISTIGKDSLEGLQSLTEINLSHNLLWHIPESISSNTLRHLDLNYNRISTVNNYTFFMLPRLTSLSVIGNRFTTIWSRSYFESNPYLETLNLADNMWRCDCNDGNMFDFYEFITLEPSKKEESYKLICNSPASIAGETWLEACYFVWNPTEKPPNPDSVIWFILTMIIGLGLCFVLVNCIRMSMKRRLAAIQAERERQVEEARNRLRELRMRAEQEALCNTPDARDLIAPPSYDEALSMPKLNTSCRSLNEVGTGKTKRKRGRRKTKSSSDLLEETTRNGDVSTTDDFELAERSDDNRERRRRRTRKYGSHEIKELDQSPGARRRRMSEYVADTEDSVTVEVEAELERPLRPRNHRYSDDDEPRESDF